MTDPLTSINAEELEKNVNEAYKTMHKSVKIFNDIPSKFGVLMWCTMENVLDFIANRMS